MDAERCDDVRPTDTANGVPVLVPGERPVERLLDPGL